MQEKMTALHDFISNVEILLNECDGRKDIVESDTVEYMTGRIETCRRSLKGLKDNITLIDLEVGVTDPVSFNRHLNGLLEEIRKIESEWKKKRKQLLFTVVRLIIRTYIVNVSHHLQVDQNA